MITKMLRIEFRRVFRNKSTYIALLLGSSISLIHVFHNIIPNASIWNEMSLNLKADLQYPYFLFNQWICGNTYNLEGFLYFMILPLIAVLPHSLSFCADKESGYVRQLYTHVDRRHYLIAKWGAVFLTGGLVVVIPLILNLAVCAMLLSALNPQGLAGTYINAAVLWFRIYENAPLLYDMIYLFIDFVFGGLLAVLPLFFSFFTEKKFIVLLMPFVLHIFIYSLCMMTGIPNAVQYSPVYFTFAGIGSPSGWIFVVYGMGYFVMGGLGYWLLSKKEDIF